MAPPDLRRPFKNVAISDQQKRRDLTLQRQAQGRRDAQQAARFLASSVVSFQPQHALDEEHILPEHTTEEIEIEENDENSSSREICVLQASKLSRGEARKWFSKQLLLPEWMIDVPDRLPHDWYVFGRPEGVRCFVVSNNGTTTSRTRNGSILHTFPSALPNGARTRDVSGPAQSYSILDCIFHKADQTYYVIDMVCWRGYSLYDCAFEFRLYWLNSKLGETGACNFPSKYHQFRFSTIPVYNCDRNGLLSAYDGATPYEKDGLLFYNKYAHYQSGNTPLALVWKDDNCSKHVIDTDSKGQVPGQQRPVLELLDDGKVVTSDDPPVAFGCLEADFIRKEGLQPGNLIRFSVSDRGLKCVDGKVITADLLYIEKVNHRDRAFADSFSKVMFQHMARHSSIKIDDLLSCICSSEENVPPDVEMSG